MWAHGYLYKMWSKIKWVPDLPAICDTSCTHIQSLGPKFRRYKNPWDKYRRDLFMVCHHGKMEVQIVLIDHEVEIWEFNLYIAAVKCIFVKYVCIWSIHTLSFTNYWNWYASVVWVKAQGGDSPRKPTGGLGVFLGGKILSRRYFLGVIQMPSISLGCFHIPGIFCKNSGIFRVNLGLLYLNWSKICSKC